MCFNGGGLEVRWVIELLYLLLMVLFGVLCLSECFELWLWVCDWMNEVVMWCNVGVGWVLWMVNVWGVEFVLWSEGEGCVNCGFWWCDMYFRLCFMCGWWGLSKLSCGCIIGCIWIRGNMVEFDIMYVGDVFCWKMMRLYCREV